MINKYISQICKLLKINEPQISYDTSIFKTETTMAACDIAGNTIYLKTTDNIDPDYIFAIAHELRHVWQIRYHYDEYFKNHKPVEEIGIERYNKQPAEIDANAFAAIIIMNWFNIEPLFESLSDEIYNLIADRIDAIDASDEFS